MSFRNDLPLDEGGASARAGESPLPISERLPAFYRETPELVAPLADVADDLISSLRLVFEAEEGRVARQGRFEERRAWAKDSGTPAGVIRYFENRVGAAPLVWSGYDVDEHPAGGLICRRSSHPAAILAWDRSALASIPQSVDLPDGALPLGVKVVAVLLARVPKGGIPQIGERISGEVVWRRSGQEGTASK